MTRTRAQHRSSKGRRRIGLVADTRGAAAVEFVLWLGILIVPILSAVDVSFYAYQRMQLEIAARAGAQAAWKACDTSAKWPAVQKCGGLLEARKIADMAHTYYVPFAPHCVVSPLGTMASCHVCAAVPNFLVLEWHWVNNRDFWRDFVQEGEIISKGFVTVTERPGIGVEMNEAAARQKQVPGTPWFVSGEKI